MWVAAFTIVIVPTTIVAAYCTELVLRNQISEFILRIEMFQFGIRTLVSSLPSANASNAIYNSSDQGAEDIAVLCIFVLSPASVYNVVQSVRFSDYT